MKLDTIARYRGLKIARGDIPSMGEIEERLWELFFTDQSVQNRVLKRR